MKKTVIIISLFFMGCINNAELLNTTKKERRNNIQSRKVDWILLAKQDKLIENTRQALAVLKDYRALYFPPGSVVLTEEVEE